MQAQYEASRTAYLNSPGYLADKAKRDAEYADLQEWRRIRGMMKGAEESRELDDATREIFGLDE